MGQTHLKYDCNCSTNHLGAAQHSLRPQPGAAKNSVYFHIKQPAVYQLILLFYHSRNDTAGIKFYKVQLSFYFGDICKLGDDVPFK